MPLSSHSALLNAQNSFATRCAARRRAWGTSHSGGQPHCGTHSRPGGAPASQSDGGCSCALDSSTALSGHSGGQPRSSSCAYWMTLLLPCLRLVVRRLLALACSCACNISLG